MYRPIRTRNGQDLKVYQERASDRAGDYLKARFRGSNHPQSSSWDYPRPFEGTLGVQRLISGRVPKH